VHELDTATFVQDDTGTDTAKNHSNSVGFHNNIDGEEKEVGKVQRGATIMILREELTAHVTTSGIYASNLGHWSWYLLEREEDTK
jgi:hypothetical protein